MRTIRSELGLGNYARRWTQPLIICLMMAALPLLGLGCQRTEPPDRLAGYPSVILWAWERAEDLRFIDPSEVGVAFLCGTIRLDGDDAHALPRMQPMQAPPETAFIAVVRIESGLVESPSLSAGQRSQTVLEIVRLTDYDEISAVQIDFDARLSERGFYRTLLEDLRAALPGRLPLSMTALASWCLGDCWLDGLPVDEAVPMLFEMGPDASVARRHLERGKDFAHPLCRTSYGVSTYEPLPRLRPGRRVYVFHNHAWTPEAFERVMGRLPR